MTHEIAVLPGDGLGAEVTAEALRVLEAAQSGLTDVQFAFHHYLVGAAEFLRNGDPLPQEAFEACRRADAVLLGTMGSAGPRTLAGPRPRSDWR